MVETFHRGLQMEPRPGSRPFRTLVSRSSQDEYGLCGFHPRLAPAAHSGVHDLCELLAREMDIGHAAAFTQVVNDLHEDRPFASSARYADYLALAWDYGLRFASLGDLREAIDSLYATLSPGLSGSQEERAQSLWGSVGDLFAVLGSLGKQDTSTFRWKSGQVMLLADAIADTCGEVPVRILRQLALAFDGDHRRLWRLLALEPARFHEILRLCEDGTLTDDGIGALLLFPDLYRSLALSALHSLLGVWQPGEDIQQAAIDLGPELLGLNTTSSG